MLDEHLDNSPDVDLFIVGQCYVPVGELVRPLDFPPHRLTMPRDALCCKGYMLVSRIFA
jgi:hypothetical protein